jgi:hypothetical protein
MLPLVPPSVPHARMHFLLHLFPRSDKDGTR